MNTYSLASTLLGILSDDYLYYEGIPRPEAYFTLRDDPGGHLSSENILELERYANDIYNLFLRKLCDFTGTAAYADENAIKLQALLQELIQVKKLIENRGKTDIMVR